MKVNRQELFKSIFAIVVGNLLMAFAYVMFVIPSSIVSGGSGGIGIILNSLFGIDPATFIAVFMWVAFIVGIFVFGWKFSLKTLPSVAIYPLGIFLFSNLSFLHDLSIQITNPLIAAIFGGMCYGVGGAMIYKIGGSSGGTDIPAFIISKYFNIGIDQALFGLDAVIILGGLFFVGFQEALIGIILAFISSQIVDRIIYGGSETMMMLIISEKYKEINDFILHGLNRGSTIIPTLGGYSNLPKPTIQVVISRREYHTLEKKAKDLDPNAFVIVINAKDVYGEGFKQFKDTKRERKL